MTTGVKKREDLQSAIWKAHFFYRFINENGTDLNVILPKKRGII